MTFRFPRWPVCCGMLVASAASLAAQENQDDAIEMDRFEVNDVPIEEQILPTSRPFNSVFGMNDSIVDTPRSVTIISRQQLTDISIQDVRDFSKLTSSSYTRSNFGAPGNPDIRGQYGDVFVNGMRERTTSNGNGLPIDFNAVESVNIVKGPATVVQGASAYVGGYVDLITKRPYFDEFKGSTFATVGSYDTYRWGLDVGGPLSRTLAYRFSYSGEDSEGYFYDSMKKVQSLYGALTWRPSDAYELFLNAQLFYTEYTENFGVNRPTNNLIDHGLYTPGINVNNGTAGNPSDPQNSVNVLGGGNQMVYEPEVKLDRRLRLLRPGDDSIGRNFKVQAIQTFNGSPDLTIVHNTLLTYTRRDTFSSYYYHEVIDPAVTAETRLEFQKRLGAHAINAGLAARYTAVEAYNDYFFEPAAVWDITKDRNYINVYNSTAFLNSLGVERFPVPGYPGRYASPGAWNGDTNDSESTSVSPFVQANWAINDRLSILTGGRVDFLSVDSEDPYTDTAMSENVELPNLNASLLYRITPMISTYLTYNYSENTLGATANGGGFAPGATKSDLTQPSELLEAGMKFSLLDNRLFLSTAVFDQSRQNKPIGSPVATYEYQGFEFEANYQPNRSFYATFSYAATDASAPGSAPFNPFEAINVTPVAAPEVTTNYGQNGQGRMRIQGLPKHQFNTLLSYTFENGWGFSVNGTLHSEVNNNWAGTLVIPWQYEFDGSVFYQTRNWMVRATVLNFTDEDNWSPPNGTYGNESIVAEEGIRGELTVTYKF